MPKGNLKFAGMCAAAILAGCSAQTPPPLDLRAMQQPERERASDPQPISTMRPLPTTIESQFVSNPKTGKVTRPTTAPATGPALENDVTVRMSLQSVMQRAVANNLDVKIAGYQPAIDEARVTEAEANFDPTFFANLQFQRQDLQNGFGFTSENSLITSPQTGIRQNLTSGGKAELRYQAAYNQPKRGSNPLNTATVPDEFWSNDVVLEVTQPILRDFGTEVSTARITISRFTQRISLLDFRKQLEQTAADIEKNYWQLVAAEREVKINEQLLNDTVGTGEVLFKRRSQDVTRVQLSQANASIESRRASLIRAKAHVRDLSDQLKKFMNDPDMPVSSGVLVLPANEPLEEPIKFDLKDQIDTALENRFELGEQQLRIDSADLTTRVAKNNLLPQLNLVGSVDLQGLDQSLTATAVEQSRAHNLNYTVGLQFEVPIGNREARSIYRRSLLQRQQAVDTYKNLIDQVSLDVKTGLREVDTTWQEMVAFRQARFAAADALLAIQQREEGGEALTPEFVQLKLDRQESLSDSRTREAEAISNYNIAISQLELKKGTLLRYNNILMEEDALPLKGNMQ